MGLRQIPSFPSRKRLWDPPPIYKLWAGNFCKSPGHFSECTVRGGTRISMWALGLRKIPSTAFIIIVSGTWKNSDFSPPLHGPWDLKKFRARASSWALGLGKIPSLNSYRFWDIKKSRFLPLYMGWKNSTPKLSPRLWDLKKKLSFLLLRLQGVCEVSLFCLFHISFKLSL